METENSTLRFPDKSKPVAQRDIVGIALEASGHIDEKNLQQMRLDHFRRMYLLMNTSACKKYHEGDSYFFHDHFVLVKDVALSASEEKNPYENIGRRFGWLPETQIEGSFIIEEIRELPKKTLLYNLDLEITPHVAVCQLNRDTCIRIPDGCTASDANRIIYVQGQSIRTVDTVPNRPGGGIRKAA